MKTDIKHVDQDKGQEDPVISSERLAHGSGRFLASVLAGFQQMRSFAIVVILISFLGLWIQPLRTPAGSALLVASGAMLTAGDSMPATTAPATTATTFPTVSTLKSLHGTKNYWRLGEDSAGAWWFVSPTGDLEFLNAVTTVQPYQQGRDPDGPQFVSRDWIDPATGKPNLDRWAKLTLARVRAMGFKALGAWSNPVFHQFDIPMTRDLNIWTWVPPLHKRLYDPQWSSLVDAAVGAQAKPLRENRNLIGYFLDNELDWGDASSGPGVYFDGLPTGDPNRAQVLKVIHKLWPNVAAFNNDWETTFKTWAELEKSPTLPRTTGIGYRKLAGPWLEHLASDYFHITTAAVRKYDPNHLILGVRFKGYAPPEVCRASKGLTDAQSLNYYVNDALLDYDMFSSMHEESGQPILLSEYSFHALDGRSGNRNVVGFAAQVLDQQARADGYRMFTTSLARVPYVIGADWFQWSDEPPSGRTLDGEDVNFGMVDVDDRPYELLTSTVRQVASTLNALHAASPTDDEQGVWRESFANKPVMRVPYLSKPITLNGELSDWMPAAKMQGIRHSQTVGLERSHLPLPNVYLAWSEAGLYVGLEVFDNDILGAPAKGWWWTRDHVELFINTRPAPADQTEYDAFSHQFFFVPIDFPGADGATGIVGQWHRNGDALIDNLVPHPLVREATRVLNDRYVTEMFIPAKALHGFDPTHQPTMAFNIFVSNFQHATSYFWSAPKEVQTQMRPNTWGTLKLDPPPAGAKAIIRPALDQSAMLPLQ